MSRRASPEASPPAPARRPRRSAAAPAAAPNHDFQHDSIGYQLRLAQVRAYEMFFDSLAPINLSPARVTALSLIAMNPGINQATLARELDVAGPSVLKVVDALEAAGWVRRVDVEGDRRRYSLEITPEGHKTLETLSAKLAAYEQRLAGGLTAAERRTLMDLLQRVAR